MKVALFGLPQCGKSTLFTAATGLPIDPSTAHEVRQAIVRVPDARIDFLTQLCKPKKTIYATIEFIDLPGCALDDAHGQDQWRKLLPTIRQVDLVLIVVRSFENPAVPMHKDRIDPQADFTAVWDELIFGDLDAVTNRIERLEKVMTKPAKSHDLEKKELALLIECRDALESGKPIAPVMKNDDDRKLLSSFSFLTDKPIVCVNNVSDDDIGSANSLTIEHVQDNVNICASMEAEIATLEPDDRHAFMEDLGLTVPASDRLVESCYQAGGLISFLTMGPDEVRAWTISQGDSAVDAARKIHSDLAHGFIRAETVAYDDLVECGDLKNAKAAGKARKEGKSYIVADGDILNILSSA